MERVSANRRSCTFAAKAFLLTLATASLLASVAAAAATGPALAEGYTREIKPLLHTYCLPCHSTQRQKGDLDLERLSDFTLAKEGPVVWQSLIEQVGTEEMPPLDKKQPTPAERETLLRWSQGLLTHLAELQAGDPGPVVLRRLSNAEYTYTLRDLTGLPALDPAREFPADGASGEGFTNVGNSLVMSPALLTKYFDAAKELSSHAVFGPGGMTFSAKTTRRDWVDELLGEIRAFYGRYSVPGSGHPIDLQGIKLDTFDSGVLPLDRYFEVLLAERAAGRKPGQLPEGVSSRYLDTLRRTLDATDNSFLLNAFRRRWQTAVPGDGAALAEQLRPWQRALWRFNPVGLLGRVGGPPAWREPVTPVEEQMAISIPFPVVPAETVVTLHLNANDADDGNADDIVEWSRPRFQVPGREDVMLRDLPALVRSLPERRQVTYSRTRDTLAAIAAAQVSSSIPEKPKTSPSVSALQKRWEQFLGLHLGPVELGNRLKAFDETRSIEFSDGARKVITGWGYSPGPALVVNPHAEPLTILKLYPVPPKSVGLRLGTYTFDDSIVGWRSPSAGRTRFIARLEEIEPQLAKEGSLWTIELRRGTSRRKLASGIVRESAKTGPIVVDDIASQPGDLITISVTPRLYGGTNLLNIDIDVRQVSGAVENSWNLVKDLVALPTAPASTAAVEKQNQWVFAKEPTGTLIESGPLVPPGSLLARWSCEADAGRRGELADAVQQLLLSADADGASSADRTLHRELSSLSSPLFAALDEKPASTSEWISGTAASGASDLDNLKFGDRDREPNASGDSLYVKAPAEVTFTLPASLLLGCEFVTTGRLSATAGREGSVQLTASLQADHSARQLQVSARIDEKKKKNWSDAEPNYTHSAPIIVTKGSRARERVLASLAEFRRVFPAAVCYTKIVPIDEVITINLFYREDGPFADLMLTDAERKQLDSLWERLHYVSHYAITRQDSYEQLMEYATQDSDPSLFEPLRPRIQADAAALKRRLVDDEPRHLQDVIGFAARAFRRPLENAETQDLASLYGKLRAQDLPHDEAVRLVLAKVLVAPAFLYRSERPQPGTAPTPVSELELASRLSYFLWSSAPDESLRDAALSGSLRDPAVLVAHARRMTSDPRIRRLATEFGASWLHIHGFDSHDEKSEAAFPTFRDLRSSMYEESIRFFTCLFQEDRPVSELIDADYTFVNKALADHYGLTHVPFSSDEEWRKVTGMRAHSRGGILSQASTLARQSGASRTSPILRGNWISEVILGEKLPRPPKDVPPLPEAEGTAELTMRQIVERHTSDPKCHSCHKRIDPYGFSLEAFDAIGRYRATDAAGRDVDTRAVTNDGVTLDGLPALRTYLLTHREDAFLRQFCRKLLGYALGRAVQLSDRPLIDDMMAGLRAHDGRVGVAIEAIVLSKQFREIRGRDYAATP